MNKHSNRTLGRLLSSTAILLVTSQAVAQTPPPPPPPPAEEEAGDAGGLISDDIQTIEVRGVNIPDEKRATAEIASIIDESTFIRTGDSDIASALGRVTGLSLDEGKFVIVRGLNERYSSITLNGSPLPSPEPLQRVVPLDLVPTSILAGTLIQKTYSPQFSAEFGGGLIELRTKAIPDEDYFTVGGSLGINLDTHGRSVLLHDGGSKDFIGFDDGTRNIPDALAAANFGANINPSNQEAVDLSLNGSETALIVSNSPAPNWGIKTAFGLRRDLSNTVSVGANFALGFSSEWENKRGRREQGFIESAETFTLESRAVDFLSSQQSVKSSAIATVGAEIADAHKINWTNLILRSTSKDSRISVGIDGDDTDLEINQSNLEFFERQVWQSQLRGDHEIYALNNLSVAWRAAYGEAFRDAPYQRSYRYIRDITDPTSVFEYDASGLAGSTPNTVSFSKISDQNTDLGIDFVLPFEVFGTDIQAKFGYGYGDKQRRTLTRNFEYESNASVPVDVRRARIDQLLSPAIVGTPLLDLALLQSNIDLDNSASDLRVHGAYLGFDAQLGSYLRLAAGGRYEDGEQVTSAFSTVSPVATLTTTTISEDYFLPAATLTWNPIEDVQVRASFSQTITRPQFRELTPAFFLEEDSDLLVRGNPFLQNTRIDNYDARFEYYFGKGEFVTIGGFYKSIDNPIEEQFARDLGGEPVISFINAPSAILYGGEFEFEKNYYAGDLFGDKGFWSDKNLVFKANYTYSQSDVSNDGDVIVAEVNGFSGAQPTVLPGSSVFFDGRALQGQSTHLFNLQLGYENEEATERATFLVNYASSRIRNVELIISPTVSAPRVIETPPVLLDFVYSKTIETYFGGAMEFGLEVRNILGEDYSATQTFPDGTRTAFDTYQLGRKLSVSIGKKF